MTSCPICSQLKDYEFAMQKHGREEEDTQLPAAIGQLVEARDLKPGSSRRMSLERCPVCGAYYLYQTDYEYLANGSEDTQTLTRLSDEEARRYLEQT